MSPAAFTVFLDANVLAKPLTRTLLMVAGRASGYGTTWSDHVETEANRNLRPRQTPVTTVREAAGQELSPTARSASRFEATSPEDRQVLADAAESGSRFLVTEDVDDFALTDLNTVDVTAVNPDLFLASNMTTQGYVEALTFIAGRFRQPRHTAQTLHARLGRVHPRTVRAHRSVFPIQPLPPVHHPPSVSYRGGRCLRCHQAGSTTEEGMCEDCRPEI